ncbi:hypothetical protein DFJ58DRAFT_799786 [Suillus subalutaceus]|uniref:uncharacterized protein n=1 Tax=Suillus subalutaceus TaxID=48586 RepID=UPI001B875A33|nr:uncharacterized protein DFJ58DRAFT_799786 [Suillus subalutaceus]KAG1846085.1 hypothetical protein DFJ58DRAFT_799786 [Suillus subalutaceus]
MMQDDTTGRAYKQSKSTQQKQYRDREVDSFADLREAIREMTDNQETPKTKYDTLSKAAQYIRQLSLMNQKLQRQLHTLRSSRMNEEGSMMTQNPTAQAPATSLGWNADIKSVGTHRTTQIVSQSTLHDFYIGMSSGVYDAAMLEGAQDQTSIVPRFSNNMSQIDQYTSFGHPLNQSRIPYDRYSY